mgnify:FL=1
MTDKQGEFVLFVPQSGMYRVSVKNVFGEYFILEQEEIIVDFNGFKEFEVTFKFKEKPRGVNISGENPNLNNGSLFNERKVNEVEVSEPSSPQPPEDSLPSGNLQPAPPVGNQPGAGNINSAAITWEETKYFIVLGSFSDQNNARRFLDNLEVKSNALLVKTSENTYRVVYGYLTEAEARADLDKRKSIFPAAWISRKE